ncbi:Carboxylic acid transporter protein-like protein [Lachnellula suecica]|uniref:Carboxylic acid transporter protein-like protein n=1 Tax=Lachnellula suecica TaxID=602035 RepID=A0A8T9CKQ0_9HELO|nr:Carboxylic acid transporter protein-like protein [Lachnellula suecica]
MAIGIREYLSTRHTTLKPPVLLNAAANPIRLIGSLGLQQWLFFLGYLRKLSLLVEDSAICVYCSRYHHITSSVISLIDPAPNWGTIFLASDGTEHPSLHELTYLRKLGFLAWTWDAFDFHTVTLTYSELASTFDVSNSRISVGVTLVLMFRPLGAAIFGIAADRFGRKWPFIINNMLLIVFELATGFCKTYNQFLSVRALFGIAMGGIYGNAAATALEDCPDDARGLMSGVFQSGYPFGYLLATIFWKAFDNAGGHGWRPLFWFGAAPPLLLILFRLCLPETDAFNGRHAFRSEESTIQGVFIEAKFAIRTYWRRLLYLVLLMTGFNYMAHGTQDIIALMLKDKYNYSSTQITRAVVVANVGGIFGSIIAGYSSQIFGRRLSIIVLCVLGGVLLYPYTNTSGPGIYAAFFFEQFCVQGAWGIVPIHLIELSPVAFRTFVVGTAYQLGNLISAASNTIETTIGERYPLPSIVEDSNTTKVYNYSIVMCIFSACIFAYVILITFLGPEELGRSMTEDEEDDWDDVECNNTAAQISESSD